MLHFSVFLITLIIKEPPYVMYIDDAEVQRTKPQCGTQYFKGYCVDIAARVADIVGYKYNICLVKDGNYGEMLLNETWDGIIGELTRDVSWHVV